MADEIKDYVVDENFELVETPVVPQDDTISNPPTDEEVDDTVTADGTTDDDHSDDDHDPASGDDEGATDEEREAIRERRRQERKQRKQAQREREDTLRRELAARDAVINEMSERLNQIDRRNVGFDLAQIDAGMQQLNNQYIATRERLARAAASQDGEEVVAATEAMQQIREQWNQLTNARQAFVQGRNAPPPLDPRVKQFGQEWSARNKWYDPKGGDVNSRITRVIDEALVQEGWNPATKEYWDELDKRVKKQIFGGQTMPQNRQNQQPNQQPRRSGPPMGGSGGATPPAKGGYVLSAERVRAMQDAGLWNDPVLRKAAIENYKRFDQEQKGAQ